jgi:hypothetical protein
MLASILIEILALLLVPSIRNLAIIFFKAINASLKFRITWASTRPFTLCRLRSRRTYHVDVVSHLLRFCPDMGLVIQQYAYPGRDRHQKSTLICDYRNPRPSYTKPWFSNSNPTSSLSLAIMLYSATMSTR